MVNTEEITVIFWVGAFIALVLQYKLRVAPVFFIGEGLGVGGIYQTITEYNAGTLDGTTTIIMTILCVMAVIYSIWNHTQSFNGGRRK